MSENPVNSELVTKATAALQKEVDEELKEKDPSKEKAVAILKGDKDEK